MTSTAEVALEPYPAGVMPDPRKLTGNLLPTCRRDRICLWQMYRQSFTFPLAHYRNWAGAISTCLSRIKEFMGGQHIRHKAGSPVMAPGH